MTMTHNNQTHLTMAERIIDFNRGLTYSGQLPTGFAVLNPYTDNPETMEVMGASLSVSTRAETEQALQVSRSPIPNGWQASAAYRWCRLGRTKFRRSSYTI